MTAGDEAYVLTFGEFETSRHILTVENGGGSYHGLGIGLRLTKP